MANILDRFIGYVSPERAAARARARNAIRIYEGADRGRRGARGASRHVGEHRAAARSHRCAIARAISPATIRGHRACSTSCRRTSVGNGIVPVSNTGSDKIDNRVNSLWKTWIDQADITGCLSFYAMQDLAVRAMIEGGERIRFIDTELRDVEACR
jgi:capsid protein